MTHKVGAKGQVVIPKSIRDEIGFRPGDEVVFESDGNEVRVRRATEDPGERAKKIRALRGHWADRPGGGTAALERHRRQERAREKSKAKGGFAYSDAFCIATAERLAVPAWTGAPEIIGLAEQFSCPIFDLR